jgi:hypothetical protein
MRTSILICGLVLMLVSCGKEIVNNPDCDNLISGMAGQDEQLVKTEIEKLTADLVPKPLAEDPLGHSANLNELVSRLNSQCNDVVASVVCYACIETYPAISEIKMEYTVSGNLKSCIIDLMTPENDIMRYAGMHPVISGEDR